MKKAIFTLLALTLVATGAYADPKTDAEKKYQEMKAIKDAQRAERLKKKEGVATGAVKKEPTFWDREAERSGLGRMNAGGVGTWVQNLNPMPFFKSQDEQYKARKAAKVQAAR